MSETTSVAGEHGHIHGSDTAKGRAGLALAALGVVYGDIGTSPLYAMKECFAPDHGVRPTQDNVLGILSLIVWSLVLVIVVKYTSFIMRADNHGEGGTMALLSLLTPRKDDTRAPRPLVRIALVMMGLFGASLLYGDGMITPAISVLSAVEGLEVATTSVRHLVVPITFVILLGLFLAQKRGTAGIGAVFGPLTLAWFVSIAVAGLPWIFRHPGVLWAFNPYYAVHFFLEHGAHGFFVLGSVVLCITGGEALYADMGHFGPVPIRMAWYAVVFPALLCNYFGQGAYLIEHGGTGAGNPFFGLVSGIAIYPMVAIATIAAVVASQAMISGAYSITQQAVQLGYCPRVSIIHTSGAAEGQIYVPEVNTLLMVSCLTLVLVFRESSSLAAAYGIAVTGTMTITSVLFFVVAQVRWGWSLPKALALLILFLSFDLAFLSANLVKVLQGGWVPLVVATAIFVVMTTWKKGRAALARYFFANTLPLEAFLEDVRQTKPHRVAGTAVFMTSNPDGAPSVLLHHFKHNKVLHKQVIILCVQTEHVPEVTSERRVKIVDHGDGFFQVTALYGFMQMPNVLEVLQCCAHAVVMTPKDEKDLSGSYRDSGERQGLIAPEGETSFYLGRETLLTSGRSGMSKWRKGLFVFLARNARPANAFFHIPANRVVEMGTQVEL